MRSINVQKNLFTNLETLAASADVNSPQNQERINQILTQMNELTTVRTNLFNMIKGKYTHYEVELLPIAFDYFYQNK